MRERARERGMTLIELLIAMTIVAILATAVFPLSRITVKRSRELELRRGLAEIRTAIDRYKELYDQGKIAQKAGASGYPPGLSELVDGVPLAKSPGGKAKLLRRIPKDPFSEDGQWGLRSYADAPDGRIWGGEDVFDVYSRSDDTALDGTRYAEW